MVSTDTGVTGVPASAGAPAGLPMDERSRGTGSVETRETRPVDETDELIADVFQRACPSRRILEHVTGKWGVLALSALTDGSHRFGALRRHVDGVSEKMLAQSLHALERDGMVRREVRATIPPHVEYSLTPLGLRVATTLRELIELVEDGMPDVRAAQQRYDQAH